jgi:hypothetical protein
MISTNVLKDIFCFNPQLCHGRDAMVPFLSTELSTAMCPTGAPG